MTQTSILDQIKQEIESHPVILFMKGNKLLPQCGFSARVVEILEQYNIPFETRDVLQDDELRQGIKDFSNWPTIPQLYIQGEFIGGCDIVTELHNQKELKPLLENI